MKKLAISAVAVVGLLVGGAAVAEETAGDAADPQAADETPVFTNTFTTAAGETLTGDPDKGARIYNQCKSCHSLDEGRNLQGPTLYQVVGRPAGAIEGYRYSKANAGSDLTWTGQTLFDYLEAPRKYLPGTIMAYAGLRKEQHRADVIAFIARESGQLQAPAEDTPAE